MEQMTRSLWPSHGQANRNQGPRDTGIYGRLGADHLGRKTHNSYMKAEDGLSVLLYNLVVSGKNANDEATGWVLWYTITHKRVLGAVMLALTTYDVMGTISDCIKGIGVLATPGGNTLVEMKCLRGRGVSPVDWDTELQKRIRPYSIKSMLAHFPPVLLRQTM